MSRKARFPFGGAVTVEQLEGKLHPVLAKLREREPVSWLPAIDGWLVTRYDLALAVMRDPDGFTVDDARFSTARVIGPSMLSLDGAEHARQRAPFTAPFRLGALRGRLAGAAEREADDLIDRLPAGGGDLRRAFAAPLAAAVVVRALGLERTDVASVVGFYDAIVGAVSEITTGQSDGEAGRRSFSQLGTLLRGVIADHGGDSLLAAAAAGAELTKDEIVANAAVLLFGGIETTEGMIANLVLHLLEHPGLLERALAAPAAVNAAVEESLRLEPAAAVIDRYATGARTPGLAVLAAAGGRIGPRDLVRVSIAGANRDPAVFENPDEFRLDRTGARRQLAFAQGPHVCVGLHLAKLEAREAVRVLFSRLEGLRLDPASPSVVRGVVFRKPVTLHAVWDGVIGQPVSRA